MRFSRSLRSNEPCSSHLAPHSHRITSLPTPLSRKLSETLDRILYKNESVNVFWRFGEIVDGESQTQRFITVDNKLNRTVRTITKLHFNIHAKWHIHTSHQFDNLLLCQKHGQFSKWVLCLQIVYQKLVDTTKCVQQRIRRVLTPWAKVHFWRNSAIEINNSL